MGSAFYGRNAAYAAALDDGSSADLATALARNVYGVTDREAAPKAEAQPRSWFDNAIAYAQEQGAKGLAYIVFTADGGVKSPIAKFLAEDKIAALKANSVSASSARCSPACCSISANSDIGLEDTRSSPSNSP